MNVIYFTLISVFCSFANGAGSVSTEAFSLEKRGESICRLKKDTPDVCLPTLAASGYPGFEVINVRERIRQYGNFLEMKRTIPELKMPPSAIEAFGGAVFLSPEQVRTTLDDFEELAVRDLAVTRVVKKSADGSEVVPFTASVRWKSAKNPKPNGTIFVEGVIKTRQGSPAIFDPTDTADVRRRKISELFDIVAFSDSSTDRRHDILRNLERLGREVHFRIAGTKGKSVEGATIDLLNTIVAPVVFGDVFWIPEMKRSGTDIPDRLQLR